MLVNHITAFRLRKYIIAYFAGIINIPDVNLRQARRIPRSGTPFRYIRRGIFHLSNKICLFKYSVATASSTGLHASQVRYSVPMFL